MATRWSKKLWCATGATLVACGLLAGSFGVPSVARAEEAAAEQKETGPKLEDLVKGLRKVTSTDGDSMLTLYVGKPDEKNANRLLAVIPKGLIGRDLLLAMSVSRGPNMGYPAGTALVRFQQVGNTLLISVPDVRQKQTPGKAVTGAVESTYTGSFIAVLPILCKAGNDPVVDLGDALLDAAAGEMATPGMLPRPDLTTYSKAKVFPENVLVDVDVAMAGRGGVGTTMGVGYSLRLLPDLRQSDFTPRALDERVGYFDTVREDWNTPYSERETLIRYANRWNLKKKDPQLEVSPPEKPITFVIEKTVPLQWRRYVADGILEWNKAFEQVGITGAIVVQQQTDDNEFANVDPEDARYNFFRWIVTGRGFAMGPSRADPRTGEILDADIIFDDSMVRGFEQDFALTFGPQALATQMGPEVVGFLEQHPDFIPMGMSLDDVKQTASAMREHAELGRGHLELIVNDSQLMVDAKARRPLSHPAACDYAQGVRQQMNLISLMQAKAGDRKVPERLLGQMIKMITTHELGHTLGLRHNFKASAWLSPDEIKKRRDTGNEPTFASVMDYNAPLLFPGDRIENVKQITSPVIGPYDFWAIQYGYKQFDGAAEAKKGLAEIASRCNEPGLAFATDEDVAGLSSPDPLSNRWDMSSDIVGWANNGTMFADELLTDFDKWAVRSDEPQHFLRSAFLGLAYNKLQGLQYAARIVGGQYFNRNRAADKDATAPLTIVPPDQQRAALELLGKTVLSDDFLKVSPEMFNRLVATRLSNGEDWPASRIDFPAHQLQLSMQSSVLLMINNPVVLQRVYDAELKSDATNKFTAAELLTKTKELVWGKLEPLAAGKKFTDAQPMISSTRRNLQKQWLDLQIAMAKLPSGSVMNADLQSMVRGNLRDTAAQIAEILKQPAALDFATRSHLVETKSRIDRVLDAPELSLDALTGRGAMMYQDGVR
ncbi:MAG: zinc-dependent metalloprotease [Tepidisphaeraceae bacterium]